MTRLVRLRAVDDAVLEEMVRAAVGDAAPDEATPPITPGNTWTPERVEWLTRFHTGARAGLDGPAEEASWAVEVDGVVAGAVRLKRTAEPGVLETGIWLTRGARGRGAGRRAILAVLEQAAVLGAREVRAETGRGNEAALAILRGLGFECSDAGGDRVTARRAVPGTTRAPGR
jgi:RimJ/RimL family protein N-acetyltransferase